MSKTKIDMSSKTLSVDISKILKKTKINFTAMSDAEKFKYIISHLGFKDVSKAAREKKFIASSVEPLQIDKTIAARRGNYFLNLAQESSRIGEHRPKINAKYFGVEIECLIPFDSLGIDPDDYVSGGSCMSDCVDCNGSGYIEFTHRNSGQTTEAECQSCSGSGETEQENEDNEDNLFMACSDALGRKIKNLKIKGVDIKSDGSIRTEGKEDSHWPVELTVLFRQDDMTSLERLCKLLNDLEVEVNASCGLHVHLDARHLEIEKALIMGQKLNWSLYFLKQIVPHSRLNNSFCQLGMSKLNGERYFAVNMTAYKKYSTIEVRLHSSTTSFKKIKSWIELLSLVSNLDLEIRNLPSLRSAKKFLDLIGASDELQNYFVSRAQKFNGTTEEETECEAHNEDSQTLEIGA